MQEGESRAPSLCGGRGLDGEVGKSPSTLSRWEPRAQSHEASTCHRTPGTPTLLWSRRGAHGDPPFSLYVCLDSRNGGAATEGATSPALPAAKAGAAVSYVVPGTCGVLGGFVAVLSSGWPGWATGPSARTCGSPALCAFST